LVVEAVQNGRQFDYVVFFTVTKARKDERAHLNIFINTVEAMEHTSGGMS
jgi:hypothetical protein